MASPVFEGATHVVRPVGPVARPIHKVLTRIGWVDPTTAKVTGRGAQTVTTITPGRGANVNNIVRDTTLSTLAALGIPIAAVDAYQNIKNIPDEAAGYYAPEKSQESWDDMKKKPKESEKKDKESKDKDKESKDKESTSYAPYIGAGVGALGGGALGYGAGSYFDLTPAQKILAALLGGTVGGGLGYYVGSEMGNGKDTKKDPAKTDKKDSK